MIASSTPSSSSSSFGTPSPIDTPSPLSLSPVEVAGDGGYDLASLLSTYYPEGAGLNDGIDSLFDGLIRNDSLGMANPDSCLMHQDRGHCGCLSDATSYSVVLELSLRLRRAAEVLAHDAKHRASQSCPIHQRITDLDRRARYVYSRQRFFLVTDIPLVRLWRTSTHQRPISHLTPPTRNFRQCIRDALAMLLPQYRPIHCMPAAVGIIRRNLRIPAHRARIPSCPGIQRAAQEIGCNLQLYNYII